MVKEFDRPIADSYWVDPGRLLAGEYPGSPDASRAATTIDAFLDIGVQHFVDLTEAGELAPYQSLLIDRARSRGLSVSHVRYPIADRSVAADSDLLARILRDINVAIAGGRTVYVHCCGGGGRSGMVMGCWLAQQCGDGWKALASLDRLWTSMEKARFQPRTPETEDQIRTVLEWPNASVVEAGIAPVVGKRAVL